MAWENKNKRSPAAEIHPGGQSIRPEAISLARCGALSRPRGDLSGIRHKAR